MAPGTGHEFLGAPRPGGPLGRDKGVNGRSRTGLASFQEQCRAGGCEALSARLNAPQQQINVIKSDAAGDTAAHGSGHGMGLARYGLADGMSGPGAEVRACS